MTLPSVLIVLTRTLLALALAIGLWRFRRLPPSLRYLTGLLFFYVLIESVAFACLKLKKPNLFLIPVAVVGEFWLLTLVFIHALRWPAFTRVAPWLVGLLSAYVLLDSLLTFEAARFKPNVQIISDLFTLILAGLYFRKLLQELRVVMLRQEPIFWVSMALIVFALGDLLIALFSNYMLANVSKQMANYVWAIHNLLSIVLYGCYGWAFWLGSRKATATRAA
jgi:hypothetical protein